MDELERKDNPKVGILGGTFDPVHIGHLILGEESRFQLGLNRILFMPSHNPPHKTDRAGRASDMQRVEMLRLAIASNPHFELSMTEMERPGLSYTYQTLEHLNKVSPETEFILIIGGDCLFDFETWMKPERIAAGASIAVGSRGLHSTDELLGRAAELTEKYGARIYMLDLNPVSVSSSMLRDYRSRGRSLRYYVPREVLSYMEKEKLYI